MPLTEAEARRNLQTLVTQYNNASPDERRGMSEASVVRQYIDRLLEEVLGWPIKEPQRYKYEMHTQAGRPDLTLIPESGGTIFVEAKRFGVIGELREARTTISGTITPGQLSLPGMAVDRTPQEQQAINYAFDNGGTWAVLTNFEKLRLFNARRDWLVLSFEKPQAYLDDFDLLWQLAYENVIRGSLDVLSNQRHTAEVDTEYLAFINEWREKLAQDIIARRAENPWAFTTGGDIDLPTLRAVVQRVIDRLVVVRYAEDHLVVNPGTLRSLYEARQQSAYISLDKLLDNFFRGFDQAHNSALFAPDLADTASFSDVVLVGLLSKLYEARYRSMSPDIMGNTYEQYLGKTLIQQNGHVVTADNLETRKKQGSYYTPQVIVRHLVDHSLGRYLYGTRNGRPDGQPVPGETRKTSTEIRDLRVLDSACGSGSFLIYAYDVLRDFYEAEGERLEVEMGRQVSQIAAQMQSSTPHITPEQRVELESIEQESIRLKNYPRLILETHLYGVDLDPQAAEIAVVNLMMRAMERRHDEKRLPLILNQNVKVGNSLIGVRPDDPAMAEHADALASIRRLRQRLVETPTGAEHEQIIRNLEAAESTLDATLSVRHAEYFTDLSGTRPFHWGAAFPEVFYDADGRSLENSGFTIIVGNPPWEIVKPDLREFYAQFDPRIESELNRRQVEARIAELDAENPKRRERFGDHTRTVGEMAAYVRQSDDFAHQGRGDLATHKLFLERMYGLLQNAGRLGYIVPSGIYTDLGTKELRQMLVDEGSIEGLFSFSNERFFFHGVHHSFKFVLLGAQKGLQSDGFWAVFRFNPRVAVRPGELPGFLANIDNLIYVRRESLVRFSPDSLSVMEFQSRWDYEVTKRIYGQWPLLGQNEDVPWSVRLSNEFHMTNDRHLFNTSGDGFPLYEGKMIHQYDAFFAEPSLWIAEDRIAAQADTLRKQMESYRVIHRRIARTTDERTLISAIAPAKTACEVNATVMLIAGDPDESIKLYVCALLNSYVLDFIIRFKISTTLNMFYLYQLPVPRLVLGNPHVNRIVHRAARLTCTRSEFAAFWEEIMNKPWDESCGAADPAERQQLRNEIDAIVAHLYGLSHEDFDHILGTFPLVFPDTDEGRAKRAALLAEYERWGA